MIIFHQYVHTSIPFLMISDLAYALNSFVNTVKRWLNTSLVSSFSVKRVNEALKQNNIPQGGEIQ